MLYNEYLKVIEALRLHAWLQINHPFETGLDGLGTILEQVLLRRM